MKTFIKFSLFFAINLLLAFGIIAAMQDSDRDQLLLAEYSVKNYVEGQIDFSLLRQTEQYDEPQPDYPSMLPPLDGKPVEVVGFISPYDDMDRLDRFYVSSIASGCNFCPFPTKRDKVFVECQKDRQPRAGYAGLVRVKGTLLLKSPDSIYQSPAMLEQGYEVNLFDDEIYIIKNATTELIRGTEVQVSPAQLEQMEQQLRGEQAAK